MDSNSSSQRTVITSGHVAVINKFVLGFLKLNGVEEGILQNWSSKENQAKFKSSITKMRAFHVKRGKTVYICFCDEERKQIFKEFPDMNIRDVTCELARRWNEFKEAEGNEERMNALKKLSEESNEQYRAAKTLIKSAQPPKKKVVSAYLNFCKQQREEKPNITMKELGALWRKVKENGEEKIFEV